eukprot:g5053.t1
MTSPQILLTVYSWGRGEDGQLGLGDTNDQHTPVLIEALKNKKVLGLACGSGHTVVLTSKGEVHTWGRGDDGRLGHGDNAWKYVPRLVEALRGKQISQVTCGSYHTAAVTVDGKLFTWGGGMYGKLGHGDETGHSTPCLVETLVGKTIVQIACGSRHTVALRMDGEVYTWGDKESGVSGHGDTDGHQYYPRVVEGMMGHRVQQIAACGFHTACLTEHGNVYSWGEGKFGRLGHGNERNQLAPRLIQALRDDNVSEVSCGGFHTAAISETGKILTWGGGEHGQLGHGDKINRTVPTEVMALHEHVIIQVTCGWSHTVSLTDVGVVHTWGNGDHGKLGHGDTLKVTLPRPVIGLADKRVCRVASYNEHTAALTDPAESGIESGELGVGSVLKRDLRAMINSPDFSDTIFIVEGKPIYAHRAVLAARCDHFRAMFTHDMKERGEVEILIKEVRTPVFLALLEYIYTDTVNVGAEIAVELYAAADFYTIERLGKICERIVDNELSVENCALLFALSDKVRVRRLREMALEFLIRNFDKASKTDGFAEMDKELMIEVVRMR